MTERKYSVQALMDKIGREGLILFGTGYAAGVWMKLLRRRGLADAVRYFTVTQARSAVFEGRPVYSLADAPFHSAGEGERLPLLGAAVHEVLEPELAPVLSAAFPGECVFLHPYMFEAAFGAPVSEGRVSLGELLRAQDPEDHRITLRYAVLAHPDRGEDLYVRAQSAFTGEATARRRLAHFRELARSPRRDGVLEREPVLADTAGRLIDGLHRAALARYLGKMELPCRTVRESDLYGELFGPAVRVTTEAQKAAGFTEEDREFMGKCREEMLAWDTEDRGRTGWA